MRKTNKRGIVLVEVLLAVGILGALLVPILNFFSASIETSWFASREIEAQGLILEQMEALRSIKGENWEDLIEGSFYLNLNGFTWELVPSETGEVIGPFTRRVEISRVYRDESDAIVNQGDPGARFDPSTKRIEGFISWHVLRDRSLSLQTYFTRYLDNLSWTQTTVAEFEQGEMNLVKVFDPVQDDGEIVLDGGCFTGSPESLIYDDQLRNGWRVNCNGLPFWQWLICKFFQFFNNGSIITNATDYTWNSSPNSMKVTLEPPSSGSSWSWARIYNYSGICTEGFTNIHFYAYNPGSVAAVLNFTAVYGQWDRVEIIVPPGVWTEINLDYEQVQGDWETLEAVYFSKTMSAGNPAIILYVDQLELTGGVGGYFTEGTLTSSVFDAGRETAFNRVAFSVGLPAQTECGLQVATSNAVGGPWLFYGPGGTTGTGDLYVNPAGEGIWLGNNFGRYLRYRAFLSSLDGESTPILEDVTINYSP